MADSDTQGGSRLNLTALGVGAAALTTVIASLSTTGSIGRVIRNDPDTLAVALLLVLVGAGALAAAGLPLTSGLAETMLSVLGLVLTLTGLVIGAIVGVTTAREHPEQPSLTAEYSQADRHLKGTVKTGTLTADSRVVVIVDGLRVMEGGDHYRLNTLLQTYAGPDGEGNVNVPIDLTIPAGRFDAVGINSWTEKDPHSDVAATERPASEATTEATATPEAEGAAAVTGTTEGQNARSCNYDRRVSTFPDERSRTKVGCLILPVTPVPRRPRVTLSWQGTGSDTARVEAHVLARNVPAPLYAGEPACTKADLQAPDDGRDPPCARRDERGAGVALVVVSGPPVKGRVLYRAVLEPNRNGYLKDSVQLAVPERVRTVCAVSAFVYEGAPYPTLQCPETKVSTDRAIAEIHRYPAPSKKDP